MEKDRIQWNRKGNDMEEEIKRKKKIRGNRKGKKLEMKEEEERKGTENETKSENNEK